MIIVMSKQYGTKRIKLNTCHIHGDSTFEVGLSDSDLASVLATVRRLNSEEIQLSMGYRVPITLFLQGHPILVPENPTDLLWIFIDSTGQFGFGANLKQRNFRNKLYIRRFYKYNKENADENVQINFSNLSSAIFLTKKKEHKKDLISKK